jgi:hypothetical protein
MTSLVERLRAKADTYPNRVECAASLECEAADTIEGLLAELEAAALALNEASHILRPQYKATASLFVMAADKARRAVADVTGIPS